MKMRTATRNVLAGVEPIQTANHSQAMVHGLWRGLRLLVELMPDVVQQRGFGDVAKRLRTALKPTSEVKQIISVGPERARRKLPSMLRIEEIVGPSDRLALRIKQTIGTSGGLSSRKRGQDQLRNDFALSMQSRKSSAEAPATK